MSDNPIADVFAAYGGERSGSAVRAFEEYMFDYAMERGCDLNRDPVAYARLCEVTRLMRDGALTPRSLDALRDAIYSSRSRAEEMRRRVDEALRSTTYVASRSPRESAEADAYAPSSVIRRGDPVDDSDVNGTVSVMMGQPMTSVSGTVRQYVNGEWRALRPMTATQQREADARAEWRRRTIESMGEYAWKLCGSCGRQTRRSVLCFRCRGDAPAALARWRDWITQRQRHAAPVPLDALGGVCASRLYPEAPRAHDAVKLRCPLRRSPDRGVTLCVARPTTDCVTPTRRET